jgi:hypothetical protein
VHVNKAQVIALVLLAFLIFFVVTSPDEAAKVAHALWDGLVHTAHGVVNFIDKL